MDTHDSEAPTFDLEFDISLEKVDFALSKVKLNKAPRKDSIVIEMITSLDEIEIKVMLIIYYKIWRSCK